MTTCKSCRFYAKNSRNCSLLRLPVAAWNCCKSHEVKK